MNTGHWNPDWGYTFVYSDNKVTGVLAQCPYCGYSWTYTGGDKNYATCPGRTTNYDHHYLCNKKVRLHPYLLNLKEKEIDPFGLLLYNRGRTSRSYLKYPNKNYDHISEVTKC